MAQDAPAKNDTASEKAETAPAKSSSSTASARDTSTTGGTTISSAVVQKVASVSASEISGLHALGGNVSRTVGAIRERIPGAGTTSSAGVSVEVGERQAAIDLDVVVEYGAQIVDVARAVRRNVIANVEKITGLEVVEVNIAVNDVHLPEDDGEQVSRVD